MEFENNIISDDQFKIIIFLTHFSKPISENSLFNLIPGVSAVGRIQARLQYCGRVLAGRALTPQAGAQRAPLRPARGPHTRDSVCGIRYLAWVTHGLLPLSSIVHNVYLTNNNNVCRLGPMHVIVVG